MKVTLLSVLAGLSLSGCANLLDLRSPINLWREPGVHHFGSATFETSRDGLEIIDPVCGRFVLRNPKWLVAPSHAYSFDVVEASQITDDCRGAEDARYAQVSSALDQGEDPLKFPFGSGITYSLSTCFIVDGPHCRDLVSRYIHLKRGETTLNWNLFRERERREQSLPLTVDEPAQRR